MAAVGLRFLTYAAVATVSFQNLLGRPAYDSMEQADTIKVQLIFSATQFCSGECGIGQFMEYFFWLHVIFELFQNIFTTIVCS